MKNANNIIKAFILWVVFLTLTSCIAQEKFKDSLITTFPNSIQIKSALFIGDSLLFYIDKKGKLIINQSLICDCKKCIKKRKKKQLCN